MQTAPGEEEHITADQTKHNLFHPLKAPSEGLSLLVGTRSPLPAFFINLRAGVYLVGALHGLPGLFRELKLTRDAVEIGSPLKFRCGVTVPGFVKKTASDVMPHVCFFNTGRDPLQCFFVQLCRFMPAVQTLEDLGDYQQQFSLIGRICQQPAAFPKSLAFAAEQ